MKLEYFTPRLYRRMQSDSFHVAEWESANRKYLSHLSEFLPHARRSIRNLAAAGYLHDTRIGCISIEEPSQLQLTLYDESMMGKGGSRKASNHVFNLTFSAVTSAQYDLRMLGQWWCYAEIHPSEQHYELRVLVAQNLSTFAVRFKDLKLTKTHSCGKAITR